MTARLFKQRVATTSSLKSLRKEIVEGPGLADSSRTTAWWVKNRDDFRELVLERNPQEFLIWPPVAANMVVVDHDYVLHELNHLKQDPEWLSRWKPALINERIGIPRPSAYMLSSTATSITHAYHVWRFEQATRETVTDFDFVLEFGGGFGSMCRVVHRLGFKGQYALMDLPEFAALQKFYLQNVDLGAATFKNLSFLTSIDDAKEVLENCTGRCLLIATWSLSEVPLTLRHDVADATKNFDSFLFGYGHHFEGIDNVQYFDALAQSLTNVRWKRGHIDDLPGSSYLFGTRTKVS